MAADPAPSQHAIRRTVFFSGNVQGVGFRYTCCKIAGEREVTGTVKNLLDGRVEIIAEGQPADVDEFLSHVETTMSDYIEYTTGSDSTARSNFASFDIAY
jgi:acylphosphatase